MFVICCQYTAGMTNLEITVGCQADKQRDSMQENSIHVPVTNVNYKQDNDKLCERYHMW